MLQTRGILWWRAQNPHPSSPDRVPLPHVIGSVLPLVNCVQDFTFQNFSEEDRMKAQLKGSVAALIMLLSCVGAGIAQTGTAAVRGTVTDPQSRVVPDATVTLTSIASNAVRTQKTGPVGNVSFDLIPP